jgi:hypothetical protein
VTLLKFQDIIHLSGKSADPLFETIVRLTGLRLRFERLTEVVRCHGLLRVIDADIVLAIYSLTQQGCNQTSMCRIVTGGLTLPPLTRLGVLRIFTFNPEYDIVAN